MRAFTGIEIVLLVIRLTVHYVVTCRASVERSSVAIILVPSHRRILFLITAHVSSLFPILLLVATIIACSSEIIFEWKKFGAKRKEKKIS